MRLLSIWEHTFGRVPSLLSPLLTHRCLLLLEENSSTHEEALCKPVLSKTWHFFQVHFVNPISSQELPTWPVPLPSLSNCNEEPAQSQGCRAAASSVLSLHSNASTFLHSPADKATCPTGTVTVVPSATSFWRLLSVGLVVGDAPENCPKCCWDSRRSIFPSHQLTEPQEELPLILKIHWSITSPFLLYY